FAQFAQDAGAQRVEDLPAHVEDFVAEQEVKRPRRRGVPPRDAAKEVRGPIEQMLTVALADYQGSGRRGRVDPFGEAAPGFFEYLLDERGLQATSVNGYRHHLVRFEDYLARIGVKD